MSGRSIFFLFFGIFWAVVLTSVNRYRPFDTHRLFDAPKDRGSSIGKTWLRLLVAVVILDIVPIVWLWLLAARVVPDADNGWAWASGAFAALTVFGFTRLFHGILVSDPLWRFFYSETDHSQVLQEWIGDREPVRQPNEWPNHILPGLAYLAFFVLLSSIASLLSS